MLIDLTTDGLPPGKTIEQAIARATARKEHLWTCADWERASEDEKIDALLTYCEALYGGNKVMGQLLSVIAVWGG